MQKIPANCPVQAVIVDFGEVLSFAPSDAAFARMAAVFDLTPSEFKAPYFEVRGPYDRGDITAQVYWSRVAERAQATLPATALAKLRAWDVEMWGHLNPVMLGWLVGLRTAGFALGLLSNMHADMVEHARRHFAWFALFDQLTLSHEARVVKPEAEIYRQCLQGLGVAAESTLFIDDREVNVLGARQVGLVAIRFSSLSTFEAELAGLGFPVFPSRVLGSSAAQRAFGGRVDA